MSGTRERTEHTHWSQPEIDALVKFVNSEPVEKTFIDWSPIADLIPTRSREQCVSFWNTHRDLFLCRPKRRADGGESASERSSMRNSKVENFSSRSESAVDGANLNEIEKDGDNKELSEIFDLFPTDMDKYNLVPYISEQDLDNNMETISRLIESTESAPILDVGPSNFNKEQFIEEAVFILEITAYAHHCERNVSLMLNEKFVGLSVTDLEGYIDNYEERFELLERFIIEEKLSINREDLIDSIRRLAVIAVILDNNSPYLNQQYKSFIQEITSEMSLSDHIVISYLNSMMQLFFKAFKIIVLKYRLIYGVDSELLEVVSM